MFFLFFFFFEFYCNSWQSLVESNQPSPALSLTGAAKDLEEIRKELQREYLRELEEESRRLQAEYLVRRYLSLEHHSNTKELSRIFFFLVHRLTCAQHKEQQLRETLASADSRIRQSLEQHFRRQLEEEVQRVHDEYRQREMEMTEQITAMTAQWQEQIRAAIEVSRLFLFFSLPSTLVFFFLLFVSDRSCSFIVAQEEYQEKMLEQASKLSNLLGEKYDEFADELKRKDEECRQKIEVHPFFIHYIYPLEIDRSLDAADLIFSRKFWRRRRRSGRRSTSSGSARSRGGCATRSQCSRPSGSAISRTSRRTACASSSRYSSN